MAERVTSPGRSGGTDRKTRRQIIEVPFFRGSPLGLTYRYATGGEDASARPILVDTVSNDCTGQAEKHGIQPGDKVLTVDGRFVTPVKAGEAPITLEDLRAWEATWFSTDAKLTPKHDSADAASVSSVDDYVFYKFTRSKDVAAASPERGSRGPSPARVESAATTATASTTKSKAPTATLQHHSALNQAEMTEHAVIGVSHAPLTAESVPGKASTAAPKSSPTHAAVIKAGKAGAKVRPLLTSTSNTQTNTTNATNTQTTTQTHAASSPAPLQRHFRVEFGVRWDLYSGRKASRPGASSLSQWSGNSCDAEALHLITAAARIIGAPLPADSLLDQLWEGLKEVCPQAVVTVQVPWLAQQIVGGVSTTASLLSHSAHVPLDEDLVPPSPLPSPSQSPFSSNKMQGWTVPVQHLDLAVLGAKEHLNAFSLFAQRLWFELGTNLVDAKMWSLAMKQLRKLHGPDAVYELLASLIRLDDATYHEKYHTGCVATPFGYQAPDDIILPAAPSGSSYHSGKGPDEESDLADRRRVEADAESVSKGSVRHPKPWRSGPVESTARRMSAGRSSISMLSTEQAPAEEGASPPRSRSPFSRLVMYVRLTRALTARYKDTPILKRRFRLLPTSEWLGSPDATRLFSQLCEANKPVAAVTTVEPENAMESAEKADPIITPRKPDAVLSDAKVALHPSPAGAHADAMANAEMLIRDLERRKQQVEDDASRRMAELLTEKQKAELQIEQLTTMKGQLERECSTLGSRIAGLQDEVTQARADSNKEHAALMTALAEKAALAATAAAAQQKIEELELQHAELEARISEEIYVKIEAQAELLRKENEARVLNDEIEQLTAKCDFLDGEMQVLKVLAKERAEQLDALESELHHSRAREDELTSSLEAVTRDVDEAIVRRDLAQAESNSAAANAAAQLDEANRRIRAAEDKLQQTEATMRMKSAEADKAIISLQNDFEARVDSLQLASEKEKTSLEKRHADAVLQLKLDHDKFIQELLDRQRTELVSLQKAHELQMHGLREDFVDQEGSVDVADIKAVLSTVQELRTGSKELMAATRSSLAELATDYSEAVTKVQEEFEHTLANVQQQYQKQLATAASSYDSKVCDLQEAHSVKVHELKKAHADALLAERRKLEQEIMRLITVQTEATTLHNKELAKLEQRFSTLQADFDAAQQRHEQALRVLADKYEKEMEATRAEAEQESAVNADIQRELREACAATAAVEADLKARHAAQICALDSELKSLQQQVVREREEVQASREAMTGEHSAALLAQEAAFVLEKEKLEIKHREVQKLRDQQAHQRELVILQERDETIKALQLEHQQALRMLCDTFEKASKEFETTYCERLHDLQVKLDTQSDSIQAVCEQHTTLTNQLRASHAGELAAVSEQIEIIRKEKNDLLLAAEETHSLSLSTLAQSHQRRQSELRATLLLGLQQQLLPRLRGVKQSVVSLRCELAKPLIDDDFCSNITTMASTIIVKVRELKTRGELTGEQLATVSAGVAAASDSMCNAFSSTSERADMCINRAQLCATRTTSKLRDLSKSLIARDFYWQEKLSRTMTKLRTEHADQLADIQQHHEMLVASLKAEAADSLQTLSMQHEVQLNHQETEYARMKAELLHQTERMRESHQQAVQQQQQDLVESKEFEIQILKSKHRDDISRLHKYIESKLIALETVHQATLAALNDRLNSQQERLHAATMNHVSASQGVLVAHADELGHISRQLACFKAEAADTLSDLMQMHRTEISELQLRHRRARIQARSELQLTLQTSVLPRIVKMKQALHAVKEDVVNMSWGSECAAFSAPMLGAMVDLRARLQATITAGHGRMVKEIVQTLSLSIHAHMEQLESTVIHRLGLISARSRSVSDRVVDAASRTATREQEIICQQGTKIAELNKQHSLQLEKVMVAHEAEVSRLNERTLAQVAASKALQQELHVSLRRRQITVVMGLDNVKSRILPQMKCQLADIRNSAERTRSDALQLVETALSSLSTILSTWTSQMDKEGFMRQIKSRNDAETIASLQSRMATLNRVYCIRISGLHGLALSTNEAMQKFDVVLHIKLDNMCGRLHQLKDKAAVIGAAVALLRANASKALRGERLEFERARCNDASSQMLRQELSDLRLQYDHATTALSESRTSLASQVALNAGQVEAIRKTAALHKQTVENMEAWYHESLATLKTDLEAQLKQGERAHEAATTALKEKMLNEAKLHSDERHRDAQGFQDELEAFRNQSAARLQDYKDSFEMERAALEASWQQQRRQLELRAEALARLLAKQLGGHVQSISAELRSLRLEFEGTAAAFEQSLAVDRKELLHRLCLHQSQQSDNRMLQQTMSAIPSLVKDKLAGIQSDFKLLQDWATASIQHEQGNLANDVHAMKHSLQRYLTNIARPRPKIPSSDISLGHLGSNDAALQGDPIVDVAQAAPFHRANVPIHVFDSLSPLTEGSMHFVSPVTPIGKSPECAPDTRPTDDAFLQSSSLDNTPSSLCIGPKAADTIIIKRRLEFEQGSPATQRAVETGRNGPVQPRTPAANKTATTASATKEHNEPSKMQSVMLGALGILMSTVSIIGGVDMGRDDDSESDRGSTTASIDHTVEFELQPIAPTQDTQDASPAQSVANIPTPGTSFAASQRRTDCREVAVDNTSPPVEGNNANPLADNAGITLSTTEAPISTTGELESNDTVGINGDGILMKGTPNPTPGHLLSQEEQLRSSADQPNVDANDINLPFQASPSVPSVNTVPPAAETPKAVPSPVRYDGGSTVPQAAHVMSLAVATKLEEPIAPLVSKAATPPAAPPRSPLNGGKRVPVKPPRSAQKKAEQLPLTPIIVGKKFQLLTNNDLGVTFTYTLELPSGNKLGFKLRPGNPKCPFPMVVTIYEGVAKDDNILRVGDRIVAVNGLISSERDYESFRDAIRKLVPPLELVVWRVPRTESAVSLSPSNGGDELLSPTTASESGHFFREDERSRESYLRMVQTIRHLQSSLPLKTPVFIESGAESSETITLHGAGALPTPPISPTMPLSSVDGAAEPLKETVRAASRGTFHTVKVNCKGIRSSSPFQFTLEQVDVAGVPPRSRWGWLKTTKAAPSPDLGRYPVVTSLSPGCALMAGDIILEIADKATRDLQNDAVLSLCPSKNSVEFYVVRGAPVETILIPRSGGLAKELTVSLKGGFHGDDLPFQVALHAVSLSLGANQSFFRKGSKQAVSEVNDSFPVVVVSQFEKLLGGDVITQANGLTLAGVDADGFQRMLTEMDTPVKLTVVRGENRRILSEVQAAAKRAAAVAEQKRLSEIEKAMRKPTRAEVIRASAETYTDLTAHLQPISSLIDFGDYEACICQPSEDRQPFLDFLGIRITSSVEEDLPVVRVVDVLPGGFAEQLGYPQCGDVIMGVNGLSVVAEDALPLVLHLLEVAPQPVRLRMFRESFGAVHDIGGMPTLKVKDMRTVDGMCPVELGKELQEDELNLLLSPSQLALLGIDALDTVSNCQVGAMIIDSPAISVKRSDPLFGLLHAGDVIVGINEVSIYSILTSEVKRAVAMAKEPLLLRIQRALWTPIDTPEIPTLGGTVPTGGSPLPTVTASTISRAMQAVLGPLSLQMCGLAYDIGHDEKMKVNDAKESSIIADFMELAGVSDIVSDLPRNDLAFRQLLAACSPYTLERITYWFFRALSAAYELLNGEIIKDGRAAGSALVLADVKGSRIPVNSVRPSYAQPEAASVLRHCEPLLTLIRDTFVALHSSISRSPVTAINEVDYTQFALFMGMFEHVFGTVELCWLLSRYFPLITLIGRSTDCDMADLLMEADRCMQRDLLAIPLSPRNEQATPLDEGTRNLFRWWLSPPCAREAVDLEELISCASFAQICTSPHAPGPAVPWRFTRDRAWFGHWAASRACIVKAIAEKSHTKCALFINQGGMWSDAPLLIRNYASAHSAK